MRTRVEAIEIQCLVGLAVGMCTVLISQSRHSAPTFRQPLAFGAESRSHTSISAHFEPAIDSSTASGCIWSWMIFRKMD